MGASLQLGWTADRRTDYLRSSYRCAAAIKRRRSDSPAAVPDLRRDALSEPTELIELPTTSLDNLVDESASMGLAQFDAETFFTPGRTRKCTARVSPC